MEYFLTIDIGGTDMKYGVITKEENLVFKSVRPTNAHLGGTNIIKQIKEMFNELSEKYELKGIAISSTGGIDENTQILTPSINIINYDEINFRKELADLNVLVSAENDVNSMALCEFNLVDGFKDMKSIIALTIGTGIGGAIAVNGNLLRGSSFTAGEIGKMVINGTSTYEELASTAALVRFVKEVVPTVETGLDVFALYDKNDELVVPVVNKFYNDLATGLANLIYILNPEHIVLGGGVSNRGDKFLNELHTALKPKLWDYLQDKVTLSIAKTKNDAGMIGAFINFKNTFLN